MGQLPSAVDGTRQSAMMLSCEGLMNPPKATDTDYILFLLAAPKTVTATEAARTLQDDARDPAHDAFNRLLYRQPSDTSVVWNEATTLVNGRRGVLVLDDSTLDKPYAQHTELVVYHWSGKHHQVVRGINLLTLLWTDGEALVPCDFRLYDKPIGGHTKNEPFRAMLAEAKTRGMQPTMVAFDTWYASLENLKLLRDPVKWPWVTCFAHNRTVSTVHHRNVPISHIEIPHRGRRVHLRGYGFIRVFRTKDADGELQHRATSDVDMTEAMEARIEQFAPGFRDLVLARHTMSAPQFEAYNPNYVGGDINGGVADLRQFLFRPVPSLDPWSTPVEGLYLCSSSTPPGGGVHGMCGRAAARSVLRRQPL